MAGNHATDDLVDAWALAFARFQPDVHIEIRRDTHLTTDAFDAAIAKGDIDLVPSARELVPSEMERLSHKFGGPPIVVPIATGSYATKSGTHAIAFYVNRSNPLEKISVEQIREIYSPDGKITRWGQLGLGGDWSDRPIHVFTVPISDPNGNPLGIINYLAQKVLQGKPGWRRSIYQVDSDGPAIEQHMLHRIVREVASDRYAIGYSGFCFSDPGAKTLAVAETSAGPWYVGTRNEVAERLYPFTRTIYFAANGRQGDPLPPAVREFLRFILSREGQAVMTRGPEKYLPLTAATANDALSRVN
ncbi:MAG: substrate-binding domain-containing protein [Pseudomonadota bacterium]|nr:substrate-binding domain-containing protein [Pseudomonadota bacterium]